MPFVNVLPELAVRDHDAAVGWYERFFGRPPDRRPMDGLAEWQLTGGGGVQVSQHTDARPGQVTLAISDIDGFVVELRERGIDTEASDVASGRFRIATITDPDGNTLTLAEDLDARHKDAAGAGAQRSLVVTENITLVGVIEMIDDWFAPDDDEADVDNSDIESTIRQHMAAQGALLMGRTTFEDMRGYWPNKTDDTSGITAHLNQVDKYVVSSTLTDPGWEHTTVLVQPLADAVRALKEAPGDEIGLTGSITLVHELIAAGLVDEYRLFFHPVVVGHGRRLFEGATGMPDLRLVGATPFRSGVILLTYRPAPAAVAPLSADS